MQRAIIAGLIIPTPEVSDVKDDGFYDKNYPADYKPPRPMIHVQRKCLRESDDSLSLKISFSHSFVARARYS